MCIRDRDNIAMYYLVFAVFCFGFFVIYRTIHSPFGQVLKAIRENTPRAISLGYDVARFKLLAFVISAALAGMAGATKTLVFQLASLTDVHWHMSGEVGPVSYTHLDVYKRPIVHAYSFADLLIADNESTP